MISKTLAKTLFGTFLHAFVLLFLTLYWLSLPNIYSDEVFFIKWTSLIKKKVFNIDPKPDPTEVLFVDVSQNKTTIPQLNEFEEYSDYHRKVLVDRSHLAEFLSLLEPFQNDIKLVFLDVLLEEKSPDDSLLLQQAKRIQNKLLIATRLNKKGEYKTPIFDLPKALTTYQTSQGMYLKNNIFLQDTIKTCAMIMFEKINGSRAERKWGMTWVDDQPALNAPITDFKVRPIDFKVSSSLQEKNFAIHQMGTLLELSKFMEQAEMGQYFKQKIIMIGDFKTDIHNTVFGNIAGPIIVYNSYLTLQDGTYNISFLWLLFLFLSFWFLSYVAFTGLKFHWNFFFKKLNIKWLEETINESFILIIITILSYAIFNIHINILILILYLTVITFLWKELTKFFNNKQKSA